MKKVIFSLIIIIVLAFGGFFTWKYIIVPKDHVVVDINKEYEEYQQILYDEESKLTFIDQIGEYVTVELPIIRTRYSNELECEITYPDLQNYWIENQDDLIEMNDEELQNCLLSICESGEKKTITLTFPAIYDDGYLLLDSSCFEYQDAMSGGLYSVVRDCYIEMIEDALSEEEQ